MYDKVVNSTPNFVKNHNETILWITKPPATESRVKREDNLPMICLDFGVRTCLSGLE
jgi:hypothetical protein